MITIFPSVHKISDINKVHPTDVGYNREVTTEIRTRKFFNRVKSKLFFFKYTDYIEESENSINSKVDLGKRI